MSRLLHIFSDSIDIGRYFYRISMLDNKFIRQYYLGWVLYMLIVLSIRLAVKGLHRTLLVTGSNTLFDKMFLQCTHVYLSAQW